MIPQILVVLLYGLSLGMNIAHHGREKNGTENAWYSLVGVCLVFSLLYWGGFFDVFTRR